MSAAVVQFAAHGVHRLRHRSQRQALNNINATDERRRGESGIGVSVWTVVQAN